MLRLLQFLNENKELNEKLFRKRMIRDGKVVTKWKTDKPGVRTVKFDEYGNPHEEKLDPQEIKNRKQAHRDHAGNYERGIKKRAPKEKLADQMRRRTPDLKHYDKKNPDVNSEHDDSTL